MSAESQQLTLDLEPVDPRDETPPPHVRTGLAEFLWRVPDRVDGEEVAWSRVKAWCRRAEAEGVIR